MARRESQFQRFGLPPFSSTGGNPERRRILAGVKLIRDGVEAKPKKLGRFEGFGGVELVIPESDMPFIKARFPDTNSPDFEIRHRAWQKFLRDPASEPYRVNARSHGEQCRSITAR